MTTNEPKPEEEKLFPCHICGEEMGRHIGAYNSCPAPQEPRVASVKGLCSVCGLPPDGKRGCCKPADPKQGSEEGIDWEAASEAARKWIALPTASPGSPGPNGHLARAYLALRDEVHGLREWRHDTVHRMVTDAEERTALRAELAAAQKEIAELRGKLDAADQHVEVMRTLVATAQAARIAAEARVEGLEKLFIESVTPCEGGCVGDPDCDEVSAILARRNKEKE